MRPLAVDLYCGLGGWSEGLLSEGWRVIGFDIERHDYGDGKRYPAQLVLQDVLTLHGSQFKDAALIVASPPCQEFSYMAMPWTRAKQIRRALLGEDEFPEGYAGSRTRRDLTALFDACFRIQREASEAAGRHIPMVVENVCGAQKWVGKARWHFGSYYLWGDVPALMPITMRARKTPGFRFDGSGESSQSEAVKVSGVGFSGHMEPGYKARGFNVTAAQRYREGVKQGGSGAAWFDNALDKRRKDATKCGGDWFSEGSNCSTPRRQSSRGDSRKAASAMIAKIPIRLAQWIARVYLPSPGIVTVAGGASP